MASSICPCQRSGAIQVSNPARAPAPSEALTRRPYFKNLTANERADVPQAGAVGAQDLDGPALAGDGGRDLHDARVLRPGVGVDFLQQRDLVGEGGRGERIDFVIELLVGRARADGDRSGPALLGQRRGIGGALQGLDRDFVGMGVAGGLFRDDPKAEAFTGVIGRRFQAAVVKKERFRFGPLQKQFAVIGPLQRVLEDFEGLVGFDPGAFEDGGRGDGDGHEP